MSRTNLRALGSSISRLQLLPAALSTSKAPLLCAPLSAGAPPLGSTTRALHNKTFSPASAAPQVAPLADPPVSGLADLKVFQEEQIVQLAFKSGTTANFTMAWLRDLCSCPDCATNKFLAQQSIKTGSEVEGPLSVARFSSTEDELVIEWLTTDYKTHTSKYNLKLLSMSTEDI